MRSTVIAALIAASASGIACDDAVLWRPPAPMAKDHSNPFGWVLGPDCVDCRREAIGAPSWAPARAVLFAGNVGPEGASLAPLAQSILQPGHRADPYVPVVFQPSDEHAGPYEDEIYELLDARGITAAQAFADVQFAGPQAVVMALALLPSIGGVEGRFTFPIQISWQLYRDGALFDHGASFNACPSDTPTKSHCAPKSVSHLFATIADNNALAGGPLAPPDGDYEYRVSLSDPDGSGWRLWVPFKVGEGGVPPPPPSPVVLVPDATGWFDGNNPAGVRGAWWAAGDYYGVDGSAGNGACGLAGFQPPYCSIIASPAPDGPFTPDPGARGMCTSGVVGQVPNGSDGMPAWSTTWGTIVGFNLAVDDAGVAGPYDAILHKYTGFAFDLDATPLGGHLRVGFATVGTENNAAYWGGRDLDLSPVVGPGHYEVRWGEVGGPMYLGPGAPPFDPTRLISISFHVVPNQMSPIEYHFCVNNTALLVD